jgi:hypothetical protein
MPDELKPLPIGTQITSYLVSGYWPEGEEISYTCDDKSVALDFARMHSQGGALGVRVECRIERIVVKVESVETIYGESGT